MLRIRAALRAARHVGRRGASLLFLAEVDIFYAASLMWPSPASQQTPTNLFFASLLPLDLWAAMWAAVGLTCIAYAFRHHDRVAFTAAIGVKTLWAGFAVIGVFAGGVPVSTPAIWISFGGFVWLVSDWRDPDDHWTMRS